MLSLEALLDRSIDHLSFAEANQIACEKGRNEWSHTAAVCFYICEVNRDPKKGSKPKPEDFNPWLAKQKNVEKGIRLDENFTMLSRLASWRQR